MVQDLIVAAGTRVTLDDDPPPALAPAFKRLEINTLKDLVDLGAISSTDVLNQLLDSAQEATRASLTSRDTFLPFVPVFGTSRPDLRRFSRFVAAAPHVQTSEAQTFWRIVRTIEPTQLQHVTAASNLSKVIVTKYDDVLHSIVSFIFADVIIESNGLLELKPSVSVFSCGNLLIRHSGRIVVEGSGVRISATSIQGEQ